jgi:CubicO group peptidase (beta-lactamase class C family)
MRNAIAILLIVVFPVIALPETVPGKSAQIDALINAYHGNGQFDGVVLVSEKGQIIYRKAFGIADREWNVPMTVDTKFKIGSVSKVFTAFLILQLVQDGIISLDGTISDYIPDYQGRQKDRITVHQLLTHTSGIINSLPPGEEAVKERLHHDLRQLIRYAEEADPAGEPGKEFHYSNFGYAILACIAEKVTRKPFDVLLNEKIFRPIGMNDTKQHSDTAVEERLARGYEYKLLKGYENTTYFDNSYATGCGGLISTADDLFKWHQALLNGRLLSKGLRDKMIEPVKPFHYGYGWEVRTQAPGRSGDTLKIAEHSGSVNGFGSYMAQIPGDGSLVVVLKNSRADTYISPAHATAIGQEIISILYGGDVPLPKKSIARHIGLVVGRDGPETAEREYDLIKQTGFEGYAHDESELNQLGIELTFRFKLLDEALKIFEINMIEFPRSYNAYDSYAYVLMQKNDRRNSIKYYKKGLEILRKFPDENRGESVRRDAEKALEWIKEMGGNPSIND